MLTEKISRQQVDKLSEEIKRVLLPYTFVKGWDYKKWGNVYNVVITDTKIQATVQGTYRYLVRIDLNNPDASTCSCPVQTRCKHMAATFFYVYSLYYDPESFLQQLKLDPRPAPGAVSESGATDFAPKFPDPPKETSSLEDWYRYIKAEYDRYVALNQRDYRIGFHFFSQCLNHITGVAFSWTSPVRHFFLFHAQLFVLMQMEKHGDRLQREGYYLAEYNKHYAMEHAKRLIQLGEQLGTSKIRAEYSAQFGAIIKSLRELISSDKPYVWVNWPYIYRYLWSSLLINPQWEIEEIKYLDNLLANKKISTTARYNVSLARGHFLLLNGDDSRFMAFMNQAPRIVVGDMLYYVQGFMREKQWDRTAAWLRWLEPSLTGAFGEEFDVVCRLWTEISKKRQFQDESLAFFKSWLPKSGHHYSHALIQSGRYKTWVNLHIFYRNLPANIDPAELTQAEKADINSVLPLYHHFIFRLILQKKRDSYKEAVSLLKKLRTLYTKLKWENEWERYMKSLDIQFSRLRALKEELRKGKLING